MQICDAMSASATAAPVVLVIGGGLTGASVARALRRRLPEASVVVWEADEAIGGRFNTESVLLQGGAQALADTGAQYVTATDDESVGAAHAPLYAELLQAGVIQPMTGVVEGGRAADGAGANYVAPAGLSSIVAHLFASASVRPACARRATTLRRAGACWEVHSSGGAASELFDGVILTQPVPEQLELLNTGEGGDEWLSSRAELELSHVQYSKRYALILLFPPAAAAHFDASIGWASRYVDKAADDALVYLAYDSAKRRGAARDPAEAVSLVAHTSVPYGLRTLASGASESDVLAELTGRVRKLLPWLPEPERVLLRAWTISQVRMPIPLAAGAASLRLAPPPSKAGSEPTPPLILCGDAYSPLGSRFDGCVQSGEHAAASMLSALGVGVSE
jgi:predicted NAD/FAD-dependent oxidoreductase